MFSSPYYWISHGYYREKLKVNHFWEWKGQHLCATNKQTNTWKEKPQLSNNLTMWLSGKGKESDPTDVLANALVVCRWCVSQHVGQCVGWRIGRCVGRCVGRIRFFTFTENCTLMVSWITFIIWPLVDGWNSSREDSFQSSRGTSLEKKKEIVCHIMKIKWG